MTAVLTAPQGATTHQPPAAPAARAIGATKAYGKGESADPAPSTTSAWSSTPASSRPSWARPGSGKSTLMHSLAGLDDLTEGQVLIGDVDLTTLNDKKLTKLRRDRLGFIFQAFNLVPTLTALENITLPMDLAGRKADPVWLDLVVSTVGLNERLTHRPSELSGGQQQRVAVARALAGRPDIVFADEPTGNLDSRTGAEILAFMQQAVRDLGQTIVMVTHDPVAASYADRVVFLADGHIVDELLNPTAESVLDRMKSFGR